MHGMQEVSGSIPLTSTNETAKATASPEPLMHRLGVITIWAGIVSSLVGLVVGFVKLPTGSEQAIGFWLNFVPIGFTLLLLGTGLTQISRRNGPKRGD